MREKDPPVGLFLFVEARLTSEIAAVIVLTKKEIVEQPNSRFLRVKCLDCENEQIIFDHASTEVKCLKCGKVLARPAGGKVRLEPIARQIEELL